MGGQSVRQVVLRRHSHSLGSAAMQSLHNVRSLGLLWDVANPEAWSCLEFSVGSRLGLRSYAAQPNLNYYQAGINHKYERPQHVPRRWQPPPASDRVTNQQLQQQPHDREDWPIRSFADMNTLKRPTETAAGRLMRQQLQSITGDKSAAEASNPGGEPELDPYTHQPRNLTSQAAHRLKRRMFEVNAQQRDVLPSGVPSNYKPFRPPSRDAFRSTVNDQGKLPNRHPKHAAHSGTYTSVPQEASRPFRSDGSQSAEYQNLPAPDSRHMHGPQQGYNNLDGRFQGNGSHPFEAPSYVEIKTHATPDHLSSIGLVTRYRPQPFRSGSAPSDSRESHQEQSDQPGPWYRTGRPRPAEALLAQHSGPAYGAQQHISQQRAGSPAQGRIRSPLNSQRPTPFQRRPPQQAEAVPTAQPTQPGRKPPSVQMPREPVAIHLPDDVTVKELAAKLGETVARVEEVLTDVGAAPTSPEDLVAPDAAELAALELDRIVIFPPDVHRKDADAEPRSAVVTVMGHVDHGKTSLLDALRSTSVAAGEAGGITQHIGAFTVAMPGSQETLTFLDTPGHAAFTSMRARGAAVTDLVVLVVAAEDGVMPQTREALAHAKAAGCPIVVAITKCDLPNARPDHVEQQLLAEGLELESAGGTVQSVRVAAPSGVGLLELEEALLLQAEMMELSASRSRNAEAVVVEARLAVGQGPVATIIAKRGILRTGQPVVVGCEWGKVRALRAPGGAIIKEVLPGQPAEISGLRGMPRAGDSLMAVCSEERAQRMSRARTLRTETYRLARSAAAIAAQQAADEAADLAAADGSTELLDRRQLSVVIKGDVQGSVEAVTDAINQLSSDKVRVKVLMSGIGPVSQSDVQLASSTEATILAFNVRAPTAAVELEAKKDGVRICTQRIIYRLLEEVGDLMAGSAARVDQETQQGEATVLQVFAMRGGRGEVGPSVAGLLVKEGSLRSNMMFRVMRGEEMVHEGRCESLKRLKQTVDAVGKGTECGIQLKDFNDCQAGDHVICYSIENRPAKLSEVVSQPASA